MTMRTTTLIERDIEYPMLFGGGKTNTQSTRVEVTTEGGGIESVQATALAAAASYRTAIDDNLIDADVVDEPEPATEASSNDVDASSTPGYNPPGSWEGGPLVFERVVDLLREVDFGAAPKEIALSLNAAGIYFIQRKES